MFIWLSVSILDAGGGVNWKASNHLLGLVHEELVITEEKAKTGTEPPAGRLDKAVRISTSTGRLIRGQLGAKAQISWVVFAPQTDVTCLSCLYISTSTSTSDHILQSLGITGVSWGVWGHVTSSISGSIVFLCCCRDLSVSILGHMVMVYSYTRQG
ncbi:hypothetical protein BKA61DRAFT_142836 [Leptodontidium sp. MPI-SDFR-AT-0119]|nr:hypothetical protein BKA61DRAFT_142836 [Leptodontidium sp. MPI-SDFR-AT-0119]